MKEQLALLPRYLTAHLQLTLLALGLAVLVSLPLGVWVARSPKRETIVLGIASVVQTVPSLALLALMVPLLSWLRLPSIGYLPAAIALVLYGVLPILTNTVTALTNLDPALLEAAQAVGMTLRQQLLRVELPLALPVIVAGVRTSAVWTVGMATLSTPVGAPSLGNYIFGGLQTRNLAAVLVGSVAAAALALTLDQLMRLLLRGLKGRQKGATVAAGSGMALLALYAGAALGSNALSPGRAQLIIGTKNFTEQYILGELLSQSVTRKTSIQTDIKSGLGSTVAFDALRTGNLDAYVDYSGTLWTTILKREGTIPDRDSMSLDIARELRQRYDIHVVASLGFENAYALAMRRARAGELGIRRIGDLRAHAAALSIGADYEFLGRPEWKAIQAAYGLEFGMERSMDPALMYQAVAGGTVDVISAFSTDGRIPALDLVVLEDDRRAIPPYDALVLTGAALARRSPEAMDALKALAGHIDQKTMQHLNRLVDEGGLTPHQAAATFFAAPR
jgi:osmoprotectant transport system permease protein